uniref:Ribosomal protein L2 C-terminal domain-containing protein n=1 Tax=Romanomermis culicivorax TaxID=13658 RepID=A0A915JWZ9_ROMCU
MASVLTTANKIGHRNLHTLSCGSIQALLNHPFRRPVNPFFESRRFLPKPVKNVQYKYDFRQLENKKYTVEPFKLKKMHGRHPETGIRRNERVQGGVNFDYFWITAYPVRPPLGSIYEERVLEVRHDPNSSAYIALLAGAEGRRWTIAVDGWTAGDIIRLINRLPDIPVIPNPKEIWPVGALKEGTQICVVEVLREARTIEDLRSTVAGSSCTISGRRGDNVLIKREEDEEDVEEDDNGLSPLENHDLSLENETSEFRNGDGGHELLKMPHGREILVDKHCYAAVGRVSNPEYGEMHWGSMNMKRRFGIKQASGLWHRKDGYCGRKIKPMLPPLIPERRPPPPDRYRFTLQVKDYATGYGTNEYNPILKGR